MVTPPLAISTEVLGLTLGDESEMAGEVELDDELYILTDGDLTENGKGVEASYLARDLTKLGVLVLINGDLAGPVDAFLKGVEALPE